MQSGQLSDVKTLTRSQPEDAAGSQRSPQNTTHGMGAYHTPSASVLPGVRRHLRGRRGGLKDMPQMPLDILFEIFAFLHPRDLLNLSRATRAFRALLMSRHSACFWRQARQQVDGLPDPPSYLSEPAYANLLFSAHCHKCMRLNIHNILWIFSARYCTSCQATMFVHEREVSTFLSEAFQHESHWHLYMNTQSGSSRFSGSKYHKPEIDEIKRKWASLRDDEEKAKFREQRKALAIECQQFARLASMWQTSCQIQRSVEGSRLKNERLEAIKNKLREEGFGEVLDHMRITDLFRLRKLGPVNKPSKLTDKGWNIIRPSIIQYMMPMREKYLQERREKVIQERLKYLRQALDARQSHSIPRTAASDCEPGFLALATMPAFQALLLDESDSAEEETSATIQLCLHPFIESWTEYYKNFFTELARQGLGGNSANLDLNNLLDLAIVYFACTRCKRRQLRWPHVLAHRCFRDKSTPLTHYAIKPSFLGPNVRFDHDAPYRGEEFAMFDNHLGVARYIVALSGLSPGRATYADMEASDTRYLCWRCPILTKRTVFDWQAAIQHSTIAHSTDGTKIDPFWEVLPSDQAAIALELEQALLAQSGTLASLSRNPVNVFGCARCAWHGDFLKMERHLQVYHYGQLAEEPRLGEDLYLHEDSKPCGAPSVWVYPAAQPVYPNVEEGLLAGSGFLAPL